MYKIAVFYHLYQINNWKEILRQDINKLKEADLLKFVDFIHIGVNGKEQITPNLYCNFLNTEIQINTDFRTEFETLKRMQQFCLQNPDYNILFMHSKGVTHFNGQYYDNVLAWKEYLQFFAIENWKHCVDLLKEYDCVGTEWVEDTWVGEVYRKQGCYGGTIWWAQAAYINKLDISFLYKDGDDYRWNSEFWIGSKNPKYYNFYNSNKNLYTYYIKKEEYENILETKGLLNGS